MNHESLMVMTAHLPMKIIPRGDGGIYLERYFLHKDSEGKEHWLHRFLSADSDERPHSHPFKAKSTILCGWYAEEVTTRSGSIMERHMTNGNINVIHPETVHRIAAVKPNTWTYFIVERCRDSWSFIDKDGNEQLETASSPDWHLHHKTRAETYKELGIKQWN